MQLPALRAAADDNRHTTTPTRARKQMIKAEDIVIPPVSRGTGREVFREDINRAVRSLKEAGCSERFFFEFGGHYTEFLTI